MELLSRWQERGGGDVSRVWPHIRGSARCAPSGHCAATTCVHGRERDSWPHGTRRRSTRPAHSESLARARSIRDDRIKLREVFLLRDHARARRRRRSPRLAIPAAHRFGMPSVCVAAAPPRHAAGVLQRQRGVSAGAWLPASGAAPSGILVLGNSVGSAAEPRISVRRLCGDTFAAPAADPWYAPRFPCYAELVPREVNAPLGPPGEDRFILPGHSALNALSLSVAIGLQPSPRPAEDIQRNAERQMQCRKQRRL
jgi:hypothetical protein